ncbi:MAG: hypothetical protein K2X35_09635 [Bryobacteraceae bacterium]|nr:hypothetical protein [Bryobacteraceae bacterium]
MPNVSISRNERLYLQKQGTAYGVIPNAGGTASVGVANYCRHIGFTIDVLVQTLRRRDKTGTRSATRGERGRARVGAWRSSKSLAGSGVANQVPPCDPILVALMGADATVLAGSGAITGATNASPIVITQAAHGFDAGDVVRVTAVGGNTAANGVWKIANVTANTYELMGSAGSGAYTAGGNGSRAGVRYTLSDEIRAFTAYLFRTPASLQQRCGFGLVAQQATFNLGQDVAEWEASGSGVWLLDSDTFAGADLTQRGGLTAFPAEPGGVLPTDGGVTAGFTGMFLAGSSKLANIRSCAIEISTANEVVVEEFGTFYPSTMEGDERSVTISPSLFDQDDAGTKAVYQAALDKTQLDVFAAVGTKVGGTFCFDLKGVQMDEPSLNDGQRRMVRNYRNCRAYGSGPSSLNEMAITVL